MKLGAVIMASGFSRRFGQDNKLMMPFKTHTVIQQVVATVVAAKVFHRIVLVTAFEEIAALYHQDNRVEVIFNPYPDRGLSESVKLGTGRLDPMDGYMYVPGDQVLLTKETLISLWEVFVQNPNCIVTPVYEGYAGSPKIFPSIMKEGLLSLTGDDGGRQLVKEAGERIIGVTIEGTRDQQDIDTYEDYQSIREEVS